MCLVPGDRDPVMSLPVRPTHPYQLSLAGDTVERLRRAGGYLEDGHYGVLTMGVISPEMNAQTHSQETAL